MKDAEVVKTKRHRGLTLDQVGVHPAPGVTVLGGEDANVLGVAGRGRITDPVQLEAELLSSQRSSVTAVHLQSKELKHTGQDESKQRALFAHISVKTEGEAVSVWFHPSRN